METPFVFGAAPLVVPLMSIDAGTFWRYNQSGANPPADWILAGFDDGAWPQGAALLAELVQRFGPMRGLAPTRIGYGLGTRDNQTRPNVLRAILCEVEDATRDWEIDTVAVLQTNLDDINAEILGRTLRRALDEGALDVFHTPIQMKKNRPGILLTVLCAETEADKFTEFILRETTAFGVRRYTAERRKLRRGITSGNKPSEIGRASCRGRV